MFSSGVFVMLCFLGYFAVFLLVDSIFINQMRF